MGQILNSLDAMSTKYFHQKIQLEITKQGEQH